MRRRDVLCGLASATTGAALFRSTIAMAAPAMTTRPIPSSGEAMPIVGLGTSQVFDVGGGEARHPLAGVLRLLLEAGGKIIDTSPMYGRAEAVTGDLVGESRARHGVSPATQGR